MMIECEKYNHEWSAQPWVDEECPKCHATFEWDEEFTEDYSDRKYNF